jgi:hypothetical protein
MADVSKTNGAFSVRAYIGDSKTLLAFDLKRQSAVTNLAGFTIQVQPGREPPFYILNNLQFQTPADHAQDPTLPSNSSFNAPIHKFRWVHVPGTSHQGTQPFFGPYVYTVTPRYFDDTQSLLPLDQTLSLAVTVNVAPFAKNSLSLGFTRGFTQSQAFVRHFGKAALIRPKGDDLLFDTSAESGVNATGVRYTYRDEYEWLGFTARDQIFKTLQDVVADKTLFLDVFAYDLNEPDLLQLLLTLAKQGRIRIILDNAALHHAGTAKRALIAVRPAKKKKVPAEDRFEKLFADAAMGGAKIRRGKFDRYSHDKVFIVKSGAAPATAVRVLTGSTNFSVTGLYVNANHVIGFDDAGVAVEYANVFEEAWNDQTNAKTFRATAFATGTFSPASPQLPRIEITFSPHTDRDAATILNRIANRINQEGTQSGAKGSVLFAVMELDNGTSPVYEALNNVHANSDIFSYGISDNPSGIFLYRPDSTQGVLVTGKPIHTILPPPFNQVPNITFGHEVHHKFVVCGFGGPNAVVYCGSSNMATGGEEQNGDNLLAIYDNDVATVFAIEALALVDHFDFLDSLATGKANSAAKKTGNAKKGKKSSSKTTPPASKQQAAVDAGWFLSTTDKWAARYFNPKDLRSLDRQLFA